MHCLTLNKYENAMRKERKYETKKEGKIITLALSERPSRHVISLICYAFQPSVSSFIEREQSAKANWQKTLVKSNLWQ